MSMVICIAVQTKTEPTEIKMCLTLADCRQNCFNFTSFHLCVKTEAWHPDHSI